ncbi:MAG TPA: hypothetical protein VGV40_10425 [Solirubrobacteraceae bacterium]|nr:hypothetical protein [Solirubrobacteraceae bacterium]
MQRITPWLWLVGAGAVLQLVALGSDFYRFEGEAQDAWLGVPHTAGMLLLSAGIAVVLLVLLAMDRQPLRGRGVGLWIGVAGLLTALMVGYRMLVPPFGDTPDANNVIGIIGECYYFCLPGSEGDVPADVLVGMWIALVGSVAVALGGLIHAFGRRARETPARPVIASRQAGMTPYLGVAALGAVAMFVFGFTIFTFYTTQGGRVAWSGWLPTPQSANLALLATALVLGLVWAARRERSPLSPAGLGGVIAVIGFVTAARITYRIIQPPFGDADAGIGLAALLSLLGAVTVVAAGIAQATTFGHTRDEASGASPTAADPA